MKTNKFGILQRIGRSFMLPIAVLPAAGLLLGIGQSLTNETMLQAYGLMKVMGPGTIPYMILKVCGDCGNAVFSNLPLIFAIGVAVGMAKAEKHVAALSGAIAFFVMHTAISSMISFGDFHAMQGMVTEELGIKTLQMNVFGGVIVGLGVAWLHNRFYKVKLPDMLAFFGGTRFVPIICSAVYVFVGIGMFYIWPNIQMTMYHLSEGIHASGYGGTLFYGIMERALVPFGLHHVFYVPIWQTSLGGTMEIAGKVVEGAQNIFFAQLADADTTHFAVSATRFMTGKFPFMIFGLPGAALAMFRWAKPEKKKVVGALMFSAALTSMLTGITEPVEFMFLFVAPGLYVIHCGLAGISYMLMHMLNVTVGMTFSGGIIDMLLFGVMQGQEKTNWMMFIPVGMIYFAIYYFVFSFFIKKLDIKTPGREEDIEEEQEEADDKEEDIDLSAMLTVGLGGKGNITDIDCCVTRLRCSVRNPELINDVLLKKTGSRGIMRHGSAVQIIFGPEVTTIKTDLDNYLASNNRKMERQAKKQLKQYSKQETAIETVYAPMTGEVVELIDVGDEVFSEGMLGEGFAMKPTTGELYSPVDGTVAVVFHTKHAISIISEEGAEVLIHIGLNTVSLEGEGFQMFVEPGTKVKAGDLLCKFDLDKIEKLGCATITPVIISNSMEYTSVYLHNIGEMEAGKEILTLKK